ncbi:MAG: hybrid sensor histidine kinase/response regulator [Candidatus Cloacimonetes bacterium]|nr:hybrid sensor histidine kinase/response regulator [Candidatus Cloacimonadota bacterium]
MEDVQKILVVDDNALIRQVIVRILNQKGGFEVQTAETGLECLNVVDIFHPDLIICDIMMPDMDGFETCRKLKEKPSTCNTPVIFLSAMNETKDKVQGLEEGAVDYLTKPVQKAELLARVKTHLTLASLRKSLEQSKDEYKGLVHVMCHDMGNYLTCVHAYGELSNLMKSDDYPTLKKYNDRMFTSSEKAISFLEKIKEFEAMKESKVALVLNEYNLKEMLNESFMVFENRFHEKKIDLNLSGVDERHSIKVDREWFVLSVMNNLLSNALKFSFEESSIFVSSKVEDSKIVITVKDQGIGMREAILTKVFKTDATTSTKGTSGEKGTGFGMPLVKRWIERFDGTINLESKHQTESPKDHGTSVHITLPQ